MKTVRDDRGVTLVELMTVVAILGVLAAILGFSFQGWIGKYKVEDETKRLFADISDARARAMQKKRMTFVKLETDRYRTFEDTQTAPDGNGLLDETADTRVAEANIAYAITPVTTFSFNREGLASVTDTIHLASTMSPDYDCITIRPTRIRIGRFDDATSTCQER